jgi:hypothetical protein
MVICRGNGFRNPVKRKHKVVRKIFKKWRLKVCGLYLTCCGDDVGRPLALPLETTVADSVAVGTGDALSFCCVSGDGNLSYTGVTAVVLVELMLLLCGVFSVGATENVARPLLRIWRRYWAPRSDIQTSFLQP